MRKVLIYSNGCYTDKLETKRIEYFFKENGWVCSDRVKGADLILFETCAFNKEREDECISTIRKFIKEKDKRSRLVIGGCLPRINKQRLIDNFKGKYFDPSSTSSLDSIISARKSIQSISKSQYLLDDYYQEKTFYIKISSGCLDRCSYCAVKNVFPNLVSKPKEEIVEDFRRSLAQGNRNFCLTSEDIGTYGLDLGADLISLLEDIIKLKGKYTIILRRLNPSSLKRIGRGLIDIIGSKRIRYIYIPVQSGSNKILKLMNRKYTVEEFMDYIFKLKNNFPFLKIKTDFIVGFPGETKEDFEKSLSLILELKIDDLLAFKFSKRPNTMAWKLTDDIPEEIKDARLRKLKLVHKLMLKGKQSEKGNSRIIF